MLVFGAPRSHHRMIAGLEDAGFEIRDCLAWIFGQGFPKSLNLGNGLGTALKPGQEPIALARKPFEGTTTAIHALRGTGVLNIDACRLETHGKTFTSPRGGIWATDSTQKAPLVDNEKGRWPANVLLSEEAAASLDEHTGITGGGKRSLNSDSGRTAISTRAHNARNPNTTDSVCNYGDAGGASRFFYVAKPSRRERDFGCEHLPAKTGGEATDREDDSAGVNNPRAGAGRTGGARNFHPTVKPVALMRYLVKLITPVGGVVLDPFLGSGTTGMAAKSESRDFIGIEREADFFEIACSRVYATEVADEAA
jgi:site-specific DNA-methyltransferase (adenine-specific)